jgi:putative flippase GtrA
LGRQFWRFLAAGGTAAAANFGSRFLFSLWLPYAWAIVLAYLVGMVVAFVLMRAYVFGAGAGPPTRQAAIFAAVNLLALLQTLVVSIVLARWTPQAIAHLIGVLVPVVTSYAGHRMFTFK